MKIPQYESGAGLRPAEIDPKVASQGGRMLEDIGGMVSDLGEHFQKIQDKTQSTAAEVSLYQKFNEINTIAASDPDVWNLPDKVQPMFEKAIDDTSKGISSASARSEYQNKAALEMAKHSVVTNNMIRSRQLQESKQKVLDFGDVSMQKYWNSAHDGERESIRQNFSDKVDESVSMGVMDPTAAKAYKQTHLDKMTDGQVEKDLEISAQNTLKELEKGPEGIYKHIDEQKRTAFIGQAKNVVEKQKKEAVELHGIAMNKAESDLTQRYFNGDLKVEDVVRARIGGRVSQGFYETVVKADQSPHKSHKTDAKTYMALIDKIHDPDSDPSKLRQELLNLSASGKISQSDAKHLYTAKMITKEDESKTSISDAMAQGKIDTRQKIIEDAQKQKKLEKEQNNAWKSSMDYIKKWADSVGKNVEEKAETVQEFWRKSTEKNVKSSEALDKAKEITNKKNIEANPQIVKFPKQGLLTMDAHGNKAIVYPDGSYEEQ